MCPFATAFLFVLFTHSGVALPIQSKQVTVGGFKCDRIQTAMVYYPSRTAQKYPLLSFAHGWTEGGSSTPYNYKDLLESVAAAGYVVIASESGQSAVCWTQEKEDQARALDYIKETAEFSDRVDWAMGVGLYGHSMGGAASMGNAADRAAISKYNISAAVLNHPANAGQTTGHPSPFASEKTQIPTMYLTGSNDTICPPGGVEAMYNNAAPPKLFAEMAGANHFECQSFEAFIGPCPHGWTTQNIRWFNCYLKGMGSECAAAYGICSSGPEMTKCVGQKEETVAV